MVRSRSLFLALLLAAPAWAHGGAFTPRPTVNDTIRPPVRSMPGTARRSAGTPLHPWEYWWRLNREPILRLRERVEARTVISGTRTEGDKPFHRERVRDEILLPVMLEALRSREVEIRTAAAVALGKFRAKGAGGLLLEVLRKDKIMQVREAAMIGLALLRDPELTNELRDLANSDKTAPRLRAFAVIGLGFLRDAGFLKELMSGKAPDALRSVAALALGHGKGGFGPLLAVAADERAPDGVRGYAGSALARQAHPLAEADLMRILRDRSGNYVARAGAAIALGRIVTPQQEGTIDILGRSAARDRDRRVRPLLLMSLGRIGGDRAATHIVGAEQSNEFNKGFVYLALGLSRANGAGDVLRQMFQKIRNPGDRGACALGLALAGEKKAIPMLREHLKRSNPGFAPHGMVALGLLDDAKSIPLVQEILNKSKDPVIRREGAIALALLRRAGAVSELVELLKRSKSLYTRGAIAAALGLVGDTRAVNPLLEIYRDKGRQGEERAIALVALGRIGDLEPIPLLAQLAVDLNPYVDNEAIQELLTIL